MKSRRMSLLGPASPRRPGLVAVTVLALLLGAGCAPSRPAIPPGATVLKVTERDFHISAPTQASTGNLLLQVTNKGPDSHEFIIVRTGHRLPIRTDGVTVNEEALQTATVGALEPGEVGVRQLRLHLAPGRYQFFCNMAGHYMAGMHGELVIR
ncbi:MAG: hypothetical protein M3P18_02400 [Actinomycetota bacterium]|nr:hypothetical protein [Actinomycetota bacterium]